MAISTSFKLKFEGAAVQKGLAGVEKTFSRIGKAGLSAFKSMVSPIAKIAALLGPSVIAAGFGKILKDSSSAASNFENMKSQFELFTGSVSKAKDLIDKLREIAIKSPLELSDISEGARMLLTYGVNAEAVAEITERLSEVSAGSAERFERISYAFGQISSLGRLMGTELRQLTEAGFNPLENISKRTGETMAALKGRMEAGGISIKEVAWALKAATSEGGRFYGLNDKMAQTFSGRVSMMRDQWGRLLVDLGTGLNNGLKVAVDAIAAKMPLMAEKFSIIGERIGSAISDSVNGNYEKFAAIGGTIGTAMWVGLAASFKTLVYNNLFKMLEDYNPLRQLGSDSWRGGGKISQSRLASFEDNLRFTASGNGLPEKVEALTSGRQGLVPGTQGGYRYAQPGERSTFSDANGNKIIQLLTRIDRNLAPQP